MDGGGVFVLIFFKGGGIYLFYPPLKDPLVEGRRGGGLRVRKDVEGDEDQSNWTNPSPPPPRFERTRLIRSLPPTSLLSSAVVLSLLFLSAPFSLPFLHVPPYFLHPSRACGSASLGGALFQSQGPGFLSSGPSARPMPAFARLRTGAAADEDDSSQPPLSPTQGARCRGVPSSDEAEGGRGGGPKAGAPAKEESAAPAEEESAAEESAAKAAPA